MTAVEVRRTYLQCNTCGRSTGLAVDAAAARRAAAQLGWKFGRGRKNRSSDACKNCQLPQGYVRVFVT